jgi:UDP-glucose 4-epimerase
MKICVTGGAGFLGSHLVDALIERGDTVIIIDHLKKDKPRFINKKAVVKDYAISDERLASFFEEEQPDAVVHLAAQISVSASVEDPLKDARTNIIDSLKLLEHLRPLKGVRFIFASSGGAIYGDTKIVPTPELKDVAPISPYGISKQAFEYYLESMHVTHGLSYFCARFSNLYGPRQLVTPGGEGALIPILIKKIIKEETVSIFGDGSASRDFLYISDAVNALMAAVDSDVNGTANIASGKEVTVLEAWEVVQKIHGSNGNVEYLPKREGDIHRSLLDSSRAMELLNWESQTSFEDGVRNIYDWQKENLSIL